MTSGPGSSRTLQKDTTGTGSEGISEQVFTADWKTKRDTLLDITDEYVKDNPWARMYHKDKYARARVMTATRMLLPYVKPGDTVLDVGCYTQEARKYLPTGVKYVGVDKQLWLPHVLVRDLETLKVDSLPNCKALLCLETLEHLKHPMRLLKVMKSILQGDGSHAVFSLPNEATVFHRLRALLGVVDGECFSEKGKHLHLPSLKQTRRFLASEFDIVDTRYYIAPSACGSRQAWVGRVLSLLPDPVHQWFADKVPSLFARGFIFLCKPKFKSV